VRKTKFAVRSPSSQFAVLVPVRSPSSQFAVPVPVRSPSSQFAVLVPVRSSQSKKIDFFKLITIDIINNVNGY
jgi:hypothetical protein